MGRKPVDHQARIDGDLVADTDLSVLATRSRTAGMLSTEGERHQARGG